MYEYFYMYVLVIVRYVIISYRACSPLGAIYLQINDVVNNRHSTLLTYSHQLKCLANVKHQLCLS